MTIRSARYVACNECGEPAEITVEGVAVARALAARQGFVRFEGKDLCSRHAPSGVEPKEPREASADGADMASAETCPTYSPFNSQAGPHGKCCRCPSDKEGGGAK